MVPPNPYDPQGLLDLGDCEEEPNISSESYTEHCDSNEDKFHEIFSNDFNQNGYNYDDECEVIRLG